MPRIGLLLSAGGTLGHAFHAGVLSALSSETGWDPRTAEIVVGTSAGSIVAALLRAGLSARDIAARTLDEPVSEEGRRLADRLGAQARMPPRRAPSLGGMASARLLRQALLRPGSVRIGTAVAAALPAGRASTEVVSAAVRRVFGSRWPEQPTWICAVRLDDGERVVFGHPGSPPATLADAVAASCAIPAYFEPVVIGGRRHVDGGVHSVTNLDVLSGLGLDLVLVSSPMSGTATSLSGFDLPIRAATAARLAREAAAVRRSGTEVVSFQPTSSVRQAMGLDLMDGRRRRDVALSAADAARRQLRREDVRRKLEPLLG
jgi:NTE family protein